MKNVDEDDDEGFDESGDEGGGESGDECSNDWFSSFAGFWRVFVHCLMYICYGKYSAITFLMDEE